MLDDGAQRAPTGGPTLLEEGGLRLDHGRSVGHDVDDPAAELLEAQSYRLGVVDRGRPPAVLAHEGGRHAGQIGVETDADDAAGRQDARGEPVGEPLQELSFPPLLPALAGSARDALAPG